MRWILIILLAGLVGCSSTNEPGEDKEFKAVTLKELVDKKNTYVGKQVMLDAYVIGSEYNPSEGGAQFFVLSLGDEGAYDGSANQLYRPEVKYKIRAAEDGYNKKVIKDCFEMSNIARRTGQKVTVFGTYQPGESFYYYENGVDLRIAKIRIGNVTVNTDFADKSKIAAETPGILKKIYNGGKKLYDIVKKLSIGI
jgi:hypothetical protein